MYVYAEISTKTSAKIKMLSHLVPHDDEGGVRAGGYATTKARRQYSCQC